MDGRLALEEKVLENGRTARLIGEGTGSQTANGENPPLGIIKL